VDKADRQRKFAKAQERKQEEIQAQTLAQLKKQVEDLKKEIAEGKKPLKLQVAQLKIQVDELEKQNFHILLKLQTMERENAGYQGEIIKLAKALEILYKEKADAGNSAKVADAQ